MPQWHDSEAIDATSNPLSRSRSASRGVAAAVAVAIDAIAGFVRAADKGTGNATYGRADRGAPDIIRNGSTDDTAGNGANRGTPFRLRAGGEGENYASDEKEFLHGAFLSEVD
ncbi:hypothetical protein GCM10007864_00780 [Sinorhizobium fredii]|nr:hypothetical protein GCM10007864_00780 [Sinorhizobium fredii]